MSGVCLGLQVAAIEFARNVLGWTDAHSEEFAKTKHNVVSFSWYLLHEISDLFVWIWLKELTLTFLSWFASLNNKAFRDFCNPQKSFHTSPGSSDSNNRGCQSNFCKCHCWVWRKIDSLYCSSWKIRRGVKTPLWIKE